MRLRLTAGESSSAIVHHFDEYTRTRQNLWLVLAKVCREHCCCGHREDPAPLQHKIGCRHRQILRSSLPRREYHALIGIDRGE